jgi:hypothetical protein
MTRTPIIGVVLAATLMLSATAFAQQFGTPDQAKAMLLKAVAAVKADKAKALDMFAKGEGGFLDRDLYPYCFNVSDGKIHPFANPNGKQLFGQDTRNNKDSTGKAFGLEQFAAAQKPEGQFTEVSYMFPKPGANPTPVPKGASLPGWAIWAVASAITKIPPPSKHTSTRLGLTEAGLLREYRKPP